jgi:YwiC-like protein
MNELRTTISGIVFQTPARQDSSILKTQEKIRPVKTRGIALPTEHGAWGMLFEPIVAALGIAFSLAGLYISIVFIGAFLMRQPLKILAAERAAGRSLPQGKPARKYILIYFLIFSGGAVGSVLYASPVSFFPLAVAAPLAAIQIYFDFARQSRKLAPELAGAVGISCSAAIIALAGGWTFPEAMAIWAVLIGRSVPSIFYVRERLLLEKGKRFDRNSPVLISGAAVFAAAGLALFGLVPWLAIALMAILFIRAAIGLSRFRKPRKAMQIGLLEVVFGTATVLSIIIGYQFGL